MGCGCSTSQRCWLLDFSSFPLLPVHPTASLPASRSTSLPLLFLFTPATLPVDRLFLTFLLPSLASFLPSSLPLHPAASRSTFLSPPIPFHSCCCQPIALSLSFFSLLFSLFSLSFLFLFHAPLLFLRGSFLWLAYRRLRGPTWAMIVRGFPASRALLSFLPLFFPFLGQVHPIPTLFYPMKHV